MSVNGKLKKNELARIYHPNYEVYLEKKAAAAWNTMRLFLKKKYNIDIYPTGGRSAYRTYAEQEYFWNLYVSGRGNLAARPGTSNHGWGNAVDLATITMRDYISKHGSKFGWKKTEAFNEWWHYNYVGGFNRPNPGLSIKYPIARKGSGGVGQAWYVKKLEKRLRQLGYKKVKVDQWFGAVTESAVKNFQKLTGLKVDGIVGKETWVKLFEVNKKKLKNLRNKKEIQAKIKKLNVKLENRVKLRQESYQRWLKSKKNKDLKEFHKHKRAANYLKSLIKKNKKKLSKGAGAAPKVMEVSPEGVSFIKQFEGFFATPRNIGDGVLTVGHGHTQKLSDPKSIWIPRQKQPGVLTKEEAGELLKYDLNLFYSPAVRILFAKGGALEGLFTQQRFDALVSFAYNLGAGFATAPLGFETIQREIKNRNIQGIADSFRLYRSPNTIFEEGLLRRRLAEKELFLNNKYK